MTRLLLAALTLVATSPVDAEDPPGSSLATLRSDLESQFRETTGLGFRSFDCDGRPGPRDTELQCEAVDDEGDRFVYRLWSGSERRPASSAVWQPVEQLDGRGFEWLRAPTDRFLEAFARRDWPAVHETLSSALSDQVTTGRAEQLLAPLRDAVGDVVAFEPSMYNAPSEGRHALEYRIVSEAGELTGRFRLLAGEAGNATISAFLLVPQAGSALAAERLAERLRSALGPILGQSIEEVRLPLERLVRAGDAVEGVIVLADGTTVATRAAQAGPATDFDDNDFRFQVLEAGWLIRAHLDASNRRPVSIDCPARIVPDGGELLCSVTYGDGSSARYRLMRRGGDHRLVEIHD